MTERLVIRELPPAAATAVAAFHRESAHFHRRWEPARSAGYFEPRHHRDLLARERRSDQVVHLWLLLRDQAHSARVSRGWRGRPIVGSITLTAIVRGAFQNCVLGYKIDARHSRRGYMREALIATLDHVFGELGLHRVEISVMPANEPSIALATGLGFVPEGTSRRFLKIQDRWEDHLRMALLDDEWRRLGLSTKPS